MTVTHAKKTNPASYYVSGTRNVTKHFTEAKLKGVFRSDHADGDGRLSRQDHKNAFLCLGSSAPAWRAMRTVCQFDKDRDGYVDEEDLDNLARYAVKCGYTIDWMHLSHVRTAI